MGSLLITGTVFQGSARAPLALRTCYRQKKKLYAYIFKKNLLICITVITLQYIEYTDPYLKSLVQHIRRSHTHIHTLRMCEIMRLVVESLVYYNRLLDDHDFNAVVEDLE